jgi:hypothetical protein
MSAVYLTPIAAERENTEVEPRSAARRLRNPRSNIQVCVTVYDLLNEDGLSFKN